MPPLRDEGSALMTDLIVAAAVVLIVASATIAVGMIGATTEASREAARAAAVIAARTGNVTEAHDAARRLGPPGASVTVEVGGESVRAASVSHVDVPHPVTHRARISVSEEARMPIAPYRSNRG